MPALVILVVCAQLTLVAFGILPDQLKVLAMFLNGIPLGMMWGVIVRYLEGRQTSELLLAGLSCSFIVAGGIVRAVAAELARAGVPDVWAPAVTGLCFFLPFLLGAWFLDQLPPPTPEDIAQRVERPPTPGEDRRAFFREFAPGLVLLIIVYFFLTGYRDFRDNFMAELLRELGGSGLPEEFLWTEIPVGFGVVVALVGLYFLKGARQGLIGSYALMAGGLVLMAASTLLLDLELFRGSRLWWLIAVGLGSYLTYVPYSTVLFDRLIASTGFVGTAVFTIYLADAVGWSGAIAFPIFKDLGVKDFSHLSFLRWFTYGLSAGGTALLVFSCLYFLRKSQHLSKTP
jgi:hypothetical protein